MGLRLQSPTVFSHSASMREDETRRRSVRRGAAERLVSCDGALSEKPHVILQRPRCCSDSETTGSLWFVMNRTGASPKTQTNTSVCVSPDDLAAVQMRHIFLNSSRRFDSSTLSQRISSQSIKLSTCLSSSHRRLPAISATRSGGAPRRDETSAWTTGRIDPPGVWFFISDVPPCSER